MTDWKYISLSEMSDSCLGKMLDKEKNVGHLHPYLSNKNVRWGSFDLDNLNLMRFKDSEFERYSLKDGDLIVCEGGEPGRCAIWKGQTSVMRIQKALHRVRVREGFDSYFLYYRFLLAGKSNGLSNHFIGSTIKHLTGVRLKKMEFQFPDYKTQTKISSILSNLDSKIELNNKINSELESMAKLIYDYWFVQFDFPDENGKPYRFSGGKMVYNEELRLEIPEGWKDCLLGDVVAKTGTGLNPRNNFDLGEGNNFYVTIKNIKQGQVVLDARCDKISDESLSIINKRSDLRVGDILYTSIEPVGTTYLLRSKPTNWNINESVFTIRANFKKVSSEFLYMFLSGDYIKAYTKNVSAGSIHKGVRHGTLRDCKFILPRKEIVDAFSNKINPIFDKLELIQKENQKLSELRDWLLPMLMNGQVTVGATYGKEKERLAVAAEPGLAYHNDKTSIDALFETINHDYEVAVIQLLTDRRFGFTYGKKYTHKMFSNIEMLNTMPKFKELAFEEKGWGMFSKAIAKTIDNKRFIYFHKLESGTEVLKIRPNALKEVTDWMSKFENRDFITQVEYMLNLYEKPLIDKDMDRIELLNTVLECMKVLESDNPQAIRKQMGSWKMFEEHNKTKAEKFNENETFHMIQFVKSKLNNNQA